jgi:hypothetical protein
MMTRDEKEKEALRILRRGTVAFRHTWKFGRQENTIEVFKLKGKYACRAGEEVLGPFKGLYDALYESGLGDVAKEEGEEVASSICEGTGGMCGDGETWIYRIGGLYFGTDSWGQDSRFFETLAEAIEYFGVFLVDQNNNTVSCTEITTEEIIRQLRLREPGDNPFWVIVNGEAWEWDGEHFHPLRGHGVGEDGK